MSALDAATVRAVYATASTYRQSPNPDRMAEFDAWLDHIKRAARSDGYEDGHEIGYESGWEIGYEAGREGIMSQMGDQP